MKQDTVTESAKNSSGREKVLALYEYLAKLSDLKTTKVVDIKKHQTQTPSPYLFFLDELPNYQDYVKINWRDSLEENEEEKEVSGNSILEVRKPDFLPCPTPPRELLPWLAHGWDDRKNKDIRFSPGISVREDGTTEFLSPGYEIPDSSPTEIELFESDQKRVDLFKSWSAERKAWYDEQREIEGAQNLFVKLYTMRDDINKEPETFEIMIGTGFLALKQKPEIDYPILLQKVNVRFEADSNTLAIEDADDDPELCTSLLQEAEGLTLRDLPSLERRIKDECIHPLDRKSIPPFLKELAHSLTARSEYSDDPSKKFSDSSTELCICNQPVLFMRKTLDGTAKAIERIVEDLKNEAEIPHHLLQIVEGGKATVPPHSPKPIEQRLAEAGGESKDILLAKPANKEQLEIARRIEQYDAVLVQGPPGTGKTHTIANLTGHFLAQGKSILITSKTSKALTVLKDKMPKGLQDLCVSVLDGTNNDMEKSVDGITDRTAQSSSYQMADKARKLNSERNDLIDELKRTRKNLFDALNREYESITICGESISPANAARFVMDNEGELKDIISSPVDLRAPFPLSDEELSELYKSNLSFSAGEEAELDKNLPDISDISKPSDFERLCDHRNRAKEAKENILNSTHWTITDEGDFLTIGTEKGPIKINLDSPAETNRPAKVVLVPRSDTPWFSSIAAMGKGGGATGSRWGALFTQIETSVDASEKSLEIGFGYEVEYDGDDFVALEKLLETAKNRLKEYGDLEPHQKKGLFGRFRKDQLPDFSVVRVNGQKINNISSFEAAQAKIEADKERVRLEKLWNQQAKPCGLPSFGELDQASPEKAAQRWVPIIEETLSWYTTELPSVLKEYESRIPGISQLLREDPLQSDQEAVENAIDFVEVFSQKVLGLVSSLQSEYHIQKEFNELTSKLQKGSCYESTVCRKLIEAIANMDVTLYKNSFTELRNLDEKTEPLKRRRALLERVSKAAPGWAHDIENRIAPHDSATPPANIKKAWLWHQYDGILKEIANAPINKLQHDATDLAARYREKTAELAEARAWKHLLERTECDISLKQNLQGWKDTIKKIGKGTGKRAPKLKKEARRLMASCQKAVPAWIMPMSKALSTLNPCENKFDVVIVDEASQSDVTALAVAYLAKKLIVVGDDKQVSPLAVGIESDKEDTLAELYLKSSGIPNAHLYGSKLSLYDVALQTFQPLMLKEHFRCVPDIIGYSNKLSYDYKIKPLREASSSNLLPAVVPYRVEGALRDQGRKTNKREAEAIVRLIKACAKEPEYRGKTFGIISMLGQEQVKVIQQTVFRDLGPQFIEERRILIGDAANFQGDERDVVFLSMVDSPKKPGAPMNLATAGADDRTKKRYNVAASRAKDQLWVVHSMDPNSDLKAGDIRKGLIDYARCPKAFQEKTAEIERKAESPFEAEVGKAIVARGFRIKQQWEVGAYRLDIVAYDDNGKVAIECDGERWHSSEEAICADMERQTILERLGWRFVRIRGSEYYRNPEGTIDRVTEELNKLGIEAISEAFSEKKSDSAEECDLLNRVKRNAQELREKELGRIGQTTTNDVIEAALSSSPEDVGAEHGGRSEVQKPQTTTNDWLQLEKNAANSKGSQAIEQRSSSQEGVHSLTKRKPIASSSNLSSSAAPTPLSVREEKYIEAKILPVHLRNIGNLSNSYLSPINTSTIADYMKEIIAVEAPIEKQKLFNNTRELFGLKRSGSNIQERNQSILDRCVPHEETEWNNHTFIWKTSQDPDSYTLYRPNTPQCKRTSYELPFEEIRASVLAVLKKRNWIKTPELVSESACKLGYESVKGRLREIFGKAINQMIAEGMLTENLDGYVHFNKAQK